MLPLRSSFRTSLIASVLCAVISAPVVIAAPSEWAFAKIATVGVDGFTSLTDARVGANGTAVVCGVRNGEDGLFVVQDGVVTVVTLVGSTLPGEMRNRSILGFDLAVDPQGRVVFTAQVSSDSSPNNLEFRTYRWAAGDIAQMLPADGFVHSPGLMASDGRWVAERATGTTLSKTRVFHLTDGVTSTEVLSFHQTAGNCDGFSLLSPRSDKHGNLYFIERDHQGQLVGPGQCDLNNFIEDWKVKLVGPNARTVATGTEVFTGALSGNFFVSSRTGRPTPGSFNVNDSGAVAYVSELYNGDALAAPTERSLTVEDASGTRSIVKTLAGAPVQLGGVVGIDSAGRVAFTLFHESQNTQSLFSGADLANDRVLGPGDTLFGETVTHVSAGSMTATDGTFGDKRVFVIYYELDDEGRTAGFAIATKSFTRWTNAGSGSWSSTSNWSPSTVPDETSETIFDLDESYDVTVGTRTSGRSAIENGSVVWRGADLTLTGPLTVGGDAIFTLPEGKVTVGELTVGSLPPVDLTAAAPIARFNLSNEDTEFTTGGPTIVGNAGEGDLFISDAIMNSSEVRIGAGSKGTATVGLTHGEWTTQAVAVGFSHEATLNIERGARMSSTDVVIGEGTEVKPDLAVVNVDNEGQPSQHRSGTGNWFISGSLTIGDKLPGRLNVSKNGLMGVGDPVKTGLTSHGTLADAVIEVDGEGSTEPNRSAIFFLTEVEMGSGANSFVHLSALNGGFVHAGGELVLGEAPGAIGQILVARRNASGLRAELEQGNTSTGPLRVGRRGHGVLLIGSGGLVTCRELHVSSSLGGKGDVFIDGTDGNGDATLIATDFVMVGGDLSEGPAIAETGTLTLLNGARLESAGGVFVLRDGRIRGNGTIVTIGTLDVDGTIEPGIGFDPPLAELTPNSAPLQTRALLHRGQSGAMEARGPIVVSDRGRAFATAGTPILPDTLTIEGDVIIGENGVIELDVGGTTAGAADKLVVNGALTVGGTMVINFTNGFAPKLGDRFDLISATAVTGSFSATTMTGLEPGFQFSIEPDGSGRLALTALNDGVSTDAAPSVPPPPVVVVPVRPTITLQPRDVTGVLGGSARFEVASSTGDVAYQWRKDGIPISGAVNEVLTLTGLKDEDAGSFDVIVSAGGASTMSATARLTMPVGPTSRLANVSVRTPLASGQNLIVGFVMRGGPKPLLIRAGGPALASFVGGTHADPRISLFNAAREQVDTNDNWAGDLAPTMQKVGAFAFANNSADAAMLKVVEGIHTAHVNGLGSGIVLVEGYDALAGTSSRLVNFSARSLVGTGDAVLIAGFVIDGSGPKTVLVRGIGPALAPLGVSGVLNDPMLSVFDRSGVQLADNDNWPASLDSTFVTVGAFPLPVGSKDSALLLTLMPGIYTVHLRGAAGSTGEGLIEVYEVL